VPDVVPMITGVNGINISAVELLWDPIPDDREHMNGRVEGYTVRLFCGTISFVIQTPRQLLALITLTLK